jgi:3D-(3,5/4)-trihydroxycyclohexane-1,2-dione acylhydrolase (decyclizing)
MPDREVWVLVGDGSYLMMNSEIATSVMLDKKLNIVVLDNGGFGCIDRLQRSCGRASFNNLFANGSGIDFAGHAASRRLESREAHDRPRRQRPRRQKPRPVPPYSAPPIRSN